MNNSQAVREAMEKAFDELLSLSSEELKARLKDRPPGPIGELYRLSESFEFCTACSTCEHFKGMPPRCSLPPLTTCSKIEDDIK